MEPPLSLENEKFLQAVTDALYDIRHPQHCWHANSGSISKGRIVTDQVRCCWCGETTSRTMKWSTSTVEGHGKFHEEDYCSITYGNYEDCPREG